MTAFRAMLEDLGARVPGRRRWDRRPVAEAEGVDVPEALLEECRRLASGG